MRQQIFAESDAKDKMHIPKISASSEVVCRTITVLTTVQYRVSSAAPWKVPWKGTISGKHRTTRTHSMGNGWSTAVPLVPNVLIPQEVKIRPQLCFKLAAIYREMNKVTTQK